MKILIVSQYFYPETFRINDIVCELVKRGHVVTVLTGLPNYPNGKVFDGFEHSYKEQSIVFGAKVYRCKLRPRHRGTLNLALNYYSFIRQAKKTMKRILPDFDIVYFYEPSPIFSGIPAIQYGKKHNIKTVIYNMDIWPESMRERKNGRSRSTHNLLFVMCKLISKKIYQSFDLIVNKCDGFEKYLSNELGIKNKKMITIPEHAEDSYLKVSEIPIQNNKIDFMFLGNIGQVQNCDLLVNAFSKTNYSKAALHFVGDGSFAEDLKKLVKERGLLNNVFFHGRHSVEETIKYYNLADVCILSLSSKSSTGITIPGKLYSYLASSRAIISSVAGETSDIIDRAKCGFNCIPENVDDLANTMQKIIDNPGIIKSLGNNGRRFFLDNYTLAKHVDCLVSSFEDLLKNA